MSETNEIKISTVSENDNTNVAEVVVPAATVTTTAIIPLATMPTTTTTDTIDFVATMPTYAQIIKSENNGNTPVASPEQQQQQQQQQQQTAEKQQQQVQTEPTITTSTTTTTKTAIVTTTNADNNNKGKMDDDASLTNFKVLYVLAQLCGVTLIVLVGSWIGVHLGGLGGSDNPQLEFNWHPLLMTIGMIFLYGNSILIYRGFRNTRKKTLKLTHASIHLAVFVLTVIALKTVFDSHNLAKPNPIPNMYSLHSWLGLATVIIFGLQYVAGFTAYLVPGLKDSYKIALMPMHIYFGLFGFIMAIATALMGITEKAIFSIKGYSNLPEAGVMANMIGVLYVVFGALVVYMTTESSYKRKPIPEDAVLLTGISE